MSRTFLIVNPRASTVSEKLAANVEAALRSAGEVEVAWTEGPGHAIKLAEEADADAVVVFAGDGGANEALNGLRNGLPVGFVPGGGTSVLPRALGLPREPGAAAEQIAAALREGRTRRISLGRVNGRRFGFAAGVGLDAELVRRVDGRGRTLTGRRSGDVAFVWAGTRVLAERRGRLPETLEIAGRGRAAFVLVANGRPYTYVGRFAFDVAPQASFELGLDFVAPRNVSPLAVPRLLGYALRGRGADQAEGVLYGHDFDRIEVVCDAPLPVQADGEDLGDETNVVFEAERSAVEVLV